MKVNEMSAIVNCSDAAFLKRVNPISQCVHWVHTKHFLGLSQRSAMHCCVFCISADALLKIYTCTAVYSLILEFKKKTKLC